MPPSRRLYPALRGEPTSASTAVTPTVEEGRGVRAESESESPPDGDNDDDDDDDDDDDVSLTDFDCGGEEEEEIVTFTYGDFEMNMSVRDLDSTVASAVKRTGKVLCDKNVGKLLWKKVSTSIRALRSFSSHIAEAKAEEEEAEEAEEAEEEEEEEEEDLNPSFVRAMSSMSSSSSNHNIAPRRPRRRGGGGGGGRGGPPRHVQRLRSSARRSAISTADLVLIQVDLFDLELATVAKDWLVSFRNLDPRHQVLKFFNDLALEGVDNFVDKGRCNRQSFSAQIPLLLRMLPRNGIFSVWRPTSSDAIRKMINGDGTGKGLDIKGKSAKCGAYSGFVPFLQIHDNEHKKKVGPMRADRRVRVFYPNETSRDAAYTVLNMLRSSMVNRASTADRRLKREEEKRASRRDDGGGSGGSRNTNNSTLFMKDTRGSLTDKDRCSMTDPRVYKIEDYDESQGVYGLDIGEKLFWEGYVAPNDIARAEGSRYETGRPSMPEFQQMNIETLRNWSPKKRREDDPEDDAAPGGGGESDDPRPVLWHADCGRVGEEAPEHFDPLSPLGLLMAYEEGGKVIPVVSDFDCFLLGTRGVKYSDPLGALELSMMSMCVDEIEGILETPMKGISWTQRWLEVKKKQYKDGHGSHECPKFGYADPRSYKIMTGAVHRLKSNGAVRHGPECFNYGFPQDLDDHYLVISDSFPGVPWRYANPKELIDILCERIDEGFTFPLNPKWILCDPGWRQVYEKVMASTKSNVQDSLNIWYPDKIRRRIDEISAKFPDGFVDCGEDACASNYSSGVATDLAQLELRKYKVRAEAKEKIKHAFTKRRTIQHLRESAMACGDH